MRFLVVFAMALCAACKGDPFCGLERDGREVVMALPREGTASCLLADFNGKFANVKISDGDRAWAVVAAYQKEDPPDDWLLWRDDVSCDRTAADVTWSSLPPGFDLTVNAQCSGVLIRARFYGYVKAE